MMKKYTVILNKKDDGFYLLQTDDFEEAKERARDEIYYIERDRRKGESVELVITEDYEDGNYDPIEF